MIYITDIQFIIEMFASEEGLIPKLRDASNLDSLHTRRGYLSEPVWIKFARPRHVPRLWKKEPGNLSWK